MTKSVLVFNCLISIDNRQKLTHVLMSFESRVTVVYLVAVQAGGFGQNPGSWYCIDFIYALLIVEW